MKAPTWLRSRRALAAERDTALASAQGWQRQATVERQATRAAEAHASHWRRNVAELVGWQSEGRTDGELLRRLQQIVADGGRAQEVADGARDETEAALNTVGDIAAAAGCPDAPARWNVVEVVGRVTAARDELEAVRAELRATGHPDTDIRGGVSYAVDAAIDRERSRAQDVVERLADALGQAEHAMWPHSAPRLLREVARLTGRSISTRRVRPSDWPAGSFMARQLACTCRGSVAGSGSSVVDPRCAEHSPGYRFGGRPVQPLALPSGIREPVGWPQDLGCDHQLIRLTHGGEVVPIARCRWLAGHRGLHGNATGRSWTGEPSPTPADDGVVDTQILDALDRWEGDATSGGWVCDACGRPVDVLPCPEHQPLALADARAAVDAVPF